jgi:threonine dehydrogenase-like Zn-dependent dehydrogenase
MVAAGGPRRQVAVIGAGTLGLLTIAALRAEADVETLVATAKYPHQRELARRLGADALSAPSELDRKVRAMTGAWVLDDGQLTDGVDLVVDCVGSEASLSQALRVVAPGGEVVVVGMPGHTTLDLTSLWHRETAIRGCYAYTREDFAGAVDLVAEAGLEQLVSATYPLSRYREAIDHAANAGARGAVKIAFDLRKKAASQKDRR